MTCWAAAVRLLLVLPVLAGCAAGDAGSGPPNLVLVIGDDHGYPDFGFMGSPVVQTPRLDALAEEGVVFTHGYSTASVCRPALLTLLTGLEPLQYRLREKSLRQRARREGSGNPIESVATLPRLLSERGYASFEAGKHWEGPYALSGYDEGNVTLDHDAGGAEQGRRLVREEDASVFDFIDRNADRPFFLWFAPLLPHLPHDAPERFQRAYADVPDGLRGYYACISWFDDAVGRLVDHIRELGLERRTLFVYVVDNGWDPSPAESADTALLGGPKGKLSLHELGFRTPILLRWLDGIPPMPQRDELVSFTDVFATLLDYADVAPPPDRLGHSLRPLLEGRAPWPRREIVGHVNRLRGSPQGWSAGGSFWRDPRWHYLAPDHGEPALYDVESDPTESVDVKADHPEVVARALREIGSWFEDVKAEGRISAP